MDDKTFSKLSNMLNNSLKNSNTNSFQDFSFFNNNKNSDTQANSFNFSNLDFETISKMKNIMSQFSSNQYSPRSNLLNSLKPYLKPSRKEKLDQYIKFTNMLSIMESFNNTGDVKK